MDLEPRELGVFRALKRKLKHPWSSDAGGTTSTLLSAVMPN